MNDRFEVRDLIARGDASSVHRVWDRQLNREVALKRVRGSDAGLLLREARLLRVVSHPNIVACLDVGEDEDGAFLVMELVAGETLDQMVSLGVLSSGDFVELAAQALTALCEIHAKGFVHLDLKPENLVVSRGADGSIRLKLLDLGIAQPIGGGLSPGEIQSDAVMGSLFFMAPERFDRAPADSRSDLYSLGCVCYHALTGKHPFQGDAAPQVMVAHLRHTFVPLAELRPDLPAYVPEWIEWLFSRQIENRPTSAVVALDALRLNRAGQ